ncbi:DgyrCDS13825 [Dimorphilus gyrociliatus]|uniref:DgyrCDS13825 n=1 Tax=Dimorphilus gyrociliatus TaxID=2664684 RepID=A0A7I8WBU6_9ANNE|nr:DgyrCDS13825 [Dimorphilus gyrociliatus]
MYSTKPIVSNIKIEDNSSPMYEVKPFVCFSNGGEQNKDILLELEKRQTRLLERIDKLRIDLDTICPQVPCLGGNCEDHVISVNPNDPPFSIFVLANLLSSYHNVRVSSHVHSSITHVPKAYLLSSYVGCTSFSRNGFSMGLTFIWKDVKKPSLFVSGTRIEGEGNIARYLNSLIAAEKDIVTQTKIDDLIEDVEWRGVVSIENGNSEFLLGDKPCLADIVAWSILVRQNRKSPKIDEWMKRTMKYVYEKIAGQISVEELVEG